MQLERKFGSTTWIDLTDPSREELEALTTRASLPQNLVLDCMDPDHLPRLEADESSTYLVIRAFDLEPRSDQSSIQTLTRKIAVFSRPGLLVTIHRSPLPYLRSLFESTTPETRLIPDLITRVLKTYDVAITEIEDEFDDLEEIILDRETSSQSTKVQDLYTLKRRVTLLKRILRMTQDPLEELAETHEVSQAQEFLDKYVFKLEEVYDNLIAIISLQISISAHRANEIMRVLTVYSILFLPLNLIAGIYGMNFEHMPELKWVQGYPMALIAMASVGSGILIWLRGKGWLDRA